MVNIGLDFGSTNTLVAYYNGEEPVIVPVYNTEAYTVPSYVAYDEDCEKYEVGINAQESIGEDEYTIFRAFKMLLRENDEKKLAEWNYDQDNTPEQITKCFLEDVLHNTLNSLGEDRIGTLTVGIPEIWRKTGNRQKQNASKLLYNICKSLNLADEVKIVTEPEAASAYLAYKYANSEKQNFQGHILIVDFGGGTLDITLSNVRPGTSEDQQTQYDMQIVTEERTGAGENTIDDVSTVLKVGNGGIFYMESVIDAAFKESGINPAEEKLKHFDKYSEWVRKLEKRMITKQKEIKSIFTDYKSVGIYRESSLKELDQELFASFKHKSKGKVSITYGILARVYQDVIADTFASQLNYIIQYMDAQKIPYLNGNSKEFQLALVGGFGNFYLVQEQLERMMKVGANHSIIAGASECEKAIAFGTALYANDIVGHKYTLPYSLGIRLQDRLGHPLDCYAFHYRKEINPNEIYFIKYQGQPVPIINRKNVFDRFLMKEERDDSNREADIVRPYEEYVEKLRGVSSENTEGEDRLFIAFSMDENDCLTIYGYDAEKQVYGAPPLTEEMIKQKTPRIVVLDDINKLFPPTADI